MGEAGQDTCLERILALPGDERWEIDRAYAIRGITAYAVRSFDGDALLFCIPLLVRRPLLSEIPLDLKGAGQLNYRFLDLDQHDRTWLYLPAGIRAGVGVSGAGSMPYGYGSESITGMCSKS